MVIDTILIVIITRRIPEPDLEAIITTKSMRTNTKLKKKQKIITKPQEVQNLIYKVT